MHFNSIKEVDSYILERCKQNKEYLSTTQNFIKSFKEITVMMKLISSSYIETII